MIPENLYFKLLLFYFPVAVKYLNIKLLFKYSLRILVLILNEFFIF